MLVVFKTLGVGWAVLNNDTGELSFVRSQVETGRLSTTCNWCCDILDLAYINGYLYLSGFCYQPLDFDFFACVSPTGERAIRILSNGHYFINYNITRKTYTLSNVVVIPRVAMSYNDFKRTALLS